MISDMMVALDYLVGDLGTGEGEILQSSLLCLLLVPRRPCITLAASR